MRSNPTILAFDTSAAYCAAALLCDGQIIDSTSQEMQRGQGENLMLILEGLLSKNGLTWTNIDALGVGTGPGNFTGIRISVSAARGLALALDIAAIGVTTFESSQINQPSNHIPVVPAPRDHVYADLPNQKAALIPMSAVLEFETPLIYPPEPTILAENIAKVAAKASPNAPTAAPYYIRAADAAPSRDKPPVILSDTH